MNPRHPGGIPARVYPHKTAVEGTTVLGMIDLPTIMETQ